MKTLEELGKIADDLYAKALEFKYAWELASKQSQDADAAYESAKEQLEDEAPNPC